MENNCFTMLCWFLPHVSMKQPRVYVCPLPPSHLPPDTTPHGCHGAPGWAPCVIQQTPAVCVTRGDVYVSEPPASYSKRPLSVLHVVTCFWAPCIIEQTPAVCVTHGYVCSLHQRADARCLRYTWWRVCFWAPCVIQQTPTVCVTRGDVCVPCVIQQTPAVCVTRGGMCVSEPPASYSRRLLSTLHVVTCVSEPPESYSRRPLSVLHVVTCMFHC